MANHNPENCKNCSSKCAYDCAQLQYTIQYRTVPIIFPLVGAYYLQTNIIAQILSIGGEGAGVEAAETNGKQLASSYSACHSEAYIKLVYIDDIVTSDRRLDAFLQPQLLWLIAVCLSSMMTTRTQNNAFPLSSQLLLSTRL